MLTVRTRSLVNFLIVLACGASALPAQSDDKPKSRSGRVTTLPGPNTVDPAAAENLVSGRVRLVGQALENAIESLENGDLQQFAHSYQRMVRAYENLSDQLSDAAESVGKATARLETADKKLAGASAVGNGSSNRLQQLTGNVDALRSRFLAMLTTLRARYGQVTEQGLRDDLSQQMGSLVERIEQLDSIRTSLTSTSDAVSDETVRRLRSELSGMRQLLGDEHEMLVVLSESVALLVETASAQMDRSMLVLQVESQLPRDQVRRLRETRRGVQRILTDLEETRRKTHRAVMGILGGDRKVRPAGTDEKVLERVDQLLKRSGSPTAIRGRRSSGLAGGSPPAGRTQEGK